MKRFFKKLNIGKWLRRTRLSNKLYYYTIIVVIFAVFGSIVFWQLSHPHGSKAAWFDENYLYRQPVNVTQASASALLDFQVALTVDTATLISTGKMRRDCNDIRITDQGGKQLPFWVEEGSADCNSASTKIWTKASSIATSGATLFFYYGNQQAASQSSGLKTFDFFDDFDKGTLDSTKWAATGANTVSGGNLNVTTGAVYTKGTAGTEYNSKIEAKVKWTSSGASETYSGLEIANAQSTQGSNLGSNKLSYLMRGTTGSTTVLAYAADGTTNTYNIVSGATEFSSVNDTTYILGQAVAQSNIYYYKDRAQTGVYTASWTAPFYVYLGFFTGSAATTTNIQDISVDWVLSRKYTATEPTVSFGTEENSPSPVAYWAFDEGTGNVASSSGSTKLNADIYRATWQPESQCVSGKCLSFNGTDSFLQVAHNASLNAGTGSMSWSAWFRTGMTTRGIIYRKSDSSNALGVLFDIGLTVSGRTRCFIDTATALDSGTNTYNDNKWHQMSCVLDRTSNTLYLYMDGKQVSSVSASAISATNLNSTNIAQIGQGNGLFFNGFLDEVKLYPYARSAAQVQTDFANRGGLIGSGAVLGATQNSVLSNGLIGYWKMDEASWSGAAGEVIDSSGNGNNGTSVNGAVATPAAKFGNAGGFVKAASQYVDAGDISTMDGASQLTISAWVNPKSLADFQNVISKSTNAASTDRIYMSLGGSGAGVNTGVNIGIGNGANSAGYTAGGIIATNTWHLWTAVYDGTKSDNTGRLKFFLDGVEQPLTYLSTIPATTASTAYTVKIGQEQVTRYWDGSIDEARVYNRAMSPMEISQLYNFAPGPVGYWNFEEGQGSVVNDSSTYGNNGVWNGTGNTWGVGKYGGGGSFNGTNNFVNVGNNVSIGSIAGTLTVEAWVNPRTLTGIKYYVSDSSDVGNSAGYGLRSNYSCVNSFEFHIRAIDDTTKTALVCNVMMSANTWYHIAGVYDGAAARIYVNGVLSGSSTAYSGVMKSPAIYNTTIGVLASTQNHYRPDGGIDEVKVYNYARTPAQIISDMQAGAPGVTASGKNTIGYWKFDEGYGTVASDSSSFRKNGDIYRATWSQNGKFGKALSFDGTAQVALGNVTEYKIATKSASFWANPSANLSAFQGVFYGGSNWYIGMHTSNRIFVSYQKYDNTQATAASSNNTVIPKEWHQYTVTFFVSGSDVTVNFYRDGKFINASTTSTGYGNSYATSFFIGGVATAFYTGLLDEVKLYNYALTAQDVKAEYNHGSGLVFGSFSDTSALTGGSSASNSASAIYCVPGAADTCTAPVGEWLFEQGQGNTVNDTSGNNNNGTWNGTGATHWSQGKVGWGGNFNGTSDFVNVPDSTFVSPSVAVTVSAWVNGSLSSEISGAGIAGKDVSGAITNLPYALYVSAPGTVLFLITSSDTSIKTISASGLQDNTWYHVVGTYDGSTLKLYVNGVLKASDVKVGDVAVTTGTLKIGQQKAGFNRWFSGKIDQVRIYSYALTPAQIAWEYNNGKPVSRWKFDECQGPTLNDSIGTSSGTIQIGPSGTQTTVGTCQAVNTAASWYNGVAGKFNYSLNFDGTDDFVTMPSGAFSLNDNFTLSAWIKPTTDANANYNIIGSTAYSTNNSDWYFHRQRSGLGNHLSVLKLNGNQITSTGALTADSWWHVVFTLTNGSAKLYINGVLDTTSASFGAIATGNKGLVIGRRGDATSYFAGQIDDVQIFNYPLTAVQVRGVYNQNSAVRFGPSTGTP